MLWRRRPLLEVSVARCGPGLAGLPPRGRALAAALGPGGRGVLLLRPPPPPRGSGPSTLSLRVPREAGGAWGATRPRAAGKPSPWPRFGCGPVCWRRHWHRSGWPRARAERSLLPRAQHAHPGGRLRTPVCKQPWLLRAPYRVPQSPGGEGREGW